MTILIGCQNTAYFLQILFVVIPDNAQKVAAHAGSCVSCTDVPPSWRAIASAKWRTAIKVGHFVNTQLINASGICKSILRPCNWGCRLHSISNLLNFSCVRDAEHRGDKITEFATIAAANSNLLIPANAMAAIITLMTKFSSEIFIVSFNTDEVDESAHNLFFLTFASESTHLSKTFLEKKIAIWPKCDFQMNSESFKFAAILAHRLT